MKSIVSPMNVVALLISIIAIIGFIISSKKGDNLQYLWLFPTLLLPIFLVLLNFLFQYFIINPTWFIRVEIGTLLIIALVLYFAFRTPEIYTAQLPDGYDKSFIAIIYDVENTPALFETRKQLFPKNGILYSSKKHKNTMPAIQIEGHFPNGKKVNGFFSFGGALQCSKKEYTYQIWYIEEYDNSVVDILDVIRTDVHATLEEQCKYLENRWN